MMAVKQEMPFHNRAFPNGIGPSHLKLVPMGRYSNLLALSLWAMILGLALLGIFGGQPHPVVTSRTPIADLEIAAPQRLRNGEFFEMRFAVRANREIRNATLEVSQSYFKDLTINTIIPAPDNEEAKDANYRFSFGVLKPGEVLHVKVDGQINPPLFGGTSGNIALYDGEKRIAYIPVALQVWP
jgi:hypothetical protein